MWHLKRSAPLSQEHLTRVVYELLDAHHDTVRLAADLAGDQRWEVHLDYLRDLQRIAREALAHATAGDTGDDPTRVGSLLESGRRPMKSKTACDGVSLGPPSAQRRRWRRRPPRSRVGA